MVSLFGVNNLQRADGLGRPEGTLVAKLPRLPTLDEPVTVINFRELYVEV